MPDGAGCGGEEYKADEDDDGEGKEEEEEEEEGTLDEYLRPPAMPPRRWEPALTYVVVPALPKGAAVELQPLACSLASADAGAGPGGGSTSRVLLPRQHSHTYHTWSTGSREMAIERMLWPHWHLHWQPTGCWWLLPCCHVPEVVLFPVRVRGTWHAADGCLRVSFTGWMDALRSTRRLVDVQGAAADSGGEACAWECASVCSSGTFCLLQLSLSREAFTCHSSSLLRDAGTALQQAVGESLEAAQLRMQDVLCMRAYYCGDLLSEEEAAGMVLMAFRQSLETAITGACQVALWACACPCGGRGRHSSSGCCPAHRRPCSKDLEVCNKWTAMSPQDQSMSSYLVIHLFAFGMQASAR